MNGFFVLWFLILMYLTMFVVTIASVKREWNPLSALVALFALVTIGHWLHVVERMRERFEE